jgi:hypothetical protein
MYKQTQKYVKECQGVGSVITHYVSYLPFSLPFKISDTSLAASTIFHSLLFDKSVLEVIMTCTAKIRDIADKIRDIADKIRNIADRIRDIADKIWYIADKIRYTADE